MNCCTGCQPCVQQCGGGNCLPVAPCFNHYGGCCRVKSCPRMCGCSICDPCSTSPYCGACMLPWQGPLGDAQSESPPTRDVCILPSPQPVCNPESRCIKCLRLPLSPPHPDKDGCAWDKPPAPPLKLEKTTTSTDTGAKRPRPVIVCPYFYPCPYPCPCCSPSCVPSYLPYDIGCPSTCLPFMSEQGMEINPISIDLPFKAFRKPPFCPPRKCNDPSLPNFLMASKTAVKKEALVTSAELNNNCSNNACGCPSRRLDKTPSTPLGGSPSSIKNPSRNDQRLPASESLPPANVPSQKSRKVLLDTKSNAPEAYDQAAPCCCTHCQPIFKWRYYKQRYLNFCLKKNRFCCIPKMCNNVGCFSRPVRNTVGYVTGHCHYCDHPHVVLD